MKLSHYFFLLALAVTAGCSTATSKASADSKSTEKLKWQECTTPLRLATQTNPNAVMLTKLESCRDWLSQPDAPAEALYYMGRLVYEIGDVDNALKWFSLGASQGDEKALIAKLYLEDRRRDDWHPGGLGAEVYEALNQLALSGNTSAMLLLAHHYLVSSIPPSDTEIIRAKELTREAAINGDPIGEFQLGSMLVLESDSRVKQKGVDYLKSAAGHGVGAAQLMLIEIGADTSQQSISVEDTLFRYGTPEDIAIRQP